MSADFSPNLIGYSDVRPFRFFCMKVIPLVYDNSLSYYELLCKVVDYLNNVIADLEVTETNIGLLKDAFDALQEYVNNYIDSPEFEQMIDDKVREIYGDTLDEIKYVDFLMPREDEMTAYKTDMLQTMTSYLAINHGGRYFERGSAVDSGVGVGYKYGMQGYLRLYDNTSHPTVSQGDGNNPFDTESTVTIGSNTYKAIVCDCSTFLSLIRKSISYDESPYYMALNGITDEDAIYNAGLLDMSDTTKPYLTDVYGDPQTFGDAFIEHQSGNHLKLISTHLGDNITIDDDAITELETGDIIWCGNGKPEFDTRFNGIHHVGMYVKTIDELNEYATYYGQTYKACDNGNTDYGYVVSVGNHDSGVLAINTLEYWMKVYSNNENYEEKIFYCKGWSHDLIDSRYMYLTSETTDEGRFKKFKWRGGDSIIIDRSRGSIDLSNVGIRGEDLGFYYDSETTFNFDDWTDNGEWTNATQLSAYSNEPFFLASTTTRFELINLGFNNGDNGIQIVIAEGYIDETHSDTVIAQRAKANGVWTTWKTLTPIFMDIAQTSIASNSSIVVPVTFPYTFKTTPFVVASLRFYGGFTPTAGDVANVTVYVCNVTSTGCNLWICNNGASARAPRINLSIYGR